MRARLVARAKKWPWSSVRAHLAGRDDGVVTVAPALERVGPFAAFLDETADADAALIALRRAETTGRPIGSAAWINAWSTIMRDRSHHASAGPNRKNDRTWGNTGVIW